MGLFIDPTESRNKSRLPESVISQSIELPGLETLTGADILITIENPPDDIRDIANDSYSQTVAHLAWRGHNIKDISVETDRSIKFVLKVLSFKKACDAGILVQRKTGRDICSIVSGSNGAIILSRMEDWCKENWLVIVDARVERSKESKLVLNGKKLDFHYNSLDGALDAWARRGGFIKWIPRDKDLISWLARQLDYLRDRTEEKVLSLRKPIQNVVGPDDDESAKLTVLASIRGIGPDKAKRLLSHYGTVAGALEAILDPSFVIHENKCKGIGETTVVETRKLFGLSENWMKLVVIAGN